MANRKLLAEIDRVLKKVDEGVVVFEQIWDKVYSATTTAQKEKYEGDLKKEIKKLQRLRDQIKNWQGDSSIKDKTKLDASRKLIEEKMEKFKVCEKETKTKAFSKEGLAQDRTDPKQKAKAEVGDWVREAIFRLREQSDEFEAEIEQVCSGKRKKRGEELPRVSELKDAIARHEYHVEMLERVLRAVDNDQVSPEQCNDELRELVDYYLESNQDADFMEDEEMYDTLNLEPAAAIVPLVNPPTSPPTPVAAVPPNPTCSAKKASELSASKAVRGGSNDVPETSPSAAGAALSAAANAAAAAAAAVTAANAAAAAAMAGNDTVLSPVKNGRGARGGGGDSSATSPAVRMGIARPGTVAASLVSPQRRGHGDVTSPVRLQSQQPPLMSSIVKGQPSATTAAAVAAAAHAQQASLHRQQQQHQEHLQQQQRQQLLQVQMQQQQQQQQKKRSQHHTAVAAVSAAASAKTVQLDSAKVSSATDFVRGVTPGIPSGPELPPSIGMMPVAEMSELGALDSARTMMPESVKSHSRAIPPVSRNLVPTPPSFPSVAASVFESGAIFEKFDPDTLFFIFYYQQGTRQQYMAARELKRQGWRFHKKYLTWFQRHEEPKVSTDDYELG
jgi:CCR4-NOT transcription complex subunit 3